MGWGPSQVDRVGWISFAETWFIQPDQIVTGLTPKLGTVLMDGHHDKALLVGTNNGHKGDLDFILLVICCWESFLPEPCWCQENAVEIQELMKSAVDSFKMCLAPRTTEVPERAEAEHSVEEEVEDAPEPVGVTPGSSREESEMKLCAACAKDRHSFCSYVARGRYYWMWLACSLAWGKGSLL